MAELRQRKWFPFALIALALLVTLASRLAIARYLANDEPDDGKIYARIATNVLEHHVFSHAEAAPYEPSLIRLPGYPLFLAAVYSVFGHGNNTAVRMVQAVFDTATCALIFLIAWNWVQDEKRRRIAAWSAFALAALCPFIAIYVATILTETLTTFFMVAMTLAATYAFKAQTRRATIIWWATTGLLAGACVLLRPDSGLFAAAIGLTIVVSGLFMRKVSTAKSKDEGGGMKDESSVDEGSVSPSAFILPPSSLPFKSRFARTLLHGAIFSFAFILVLVPWTIRNARVFHIFQPLAPAHAEMPGEFVANGYFRWLRTWIDDQRYVEPMLWNMDSKPITLDEIPDYAFASADERARVAALLDRYNHAAQDQQAANSNQTPAPANSDSSQSADLSNQSTDSSKANANTQPSPHNSPAAPQEQAKAQSNDQNSNAGKQNSKTDKGDEDNSADDDQSNDNSDDNSDNSDEGDQSQDEAPQDQNDQGVEMTPEVDAGFAELARERIARAPFRYYIWLPVKRAAALWFNTHSGYYPFEGDLFPLEDLDHDSNQHIWLPLFAGLVWLHTLLFIAGALFLWLTRDAASRRWLLLALLMTLPRLFFFATLENPEPRYTVELFAFTAILGGIAIARINWKRLLGRKSKPPEVATD